VPRVPAKTSAPKCMRRKLAGHRAPYFRALTRWPDIGLKRSKTHFDATIRSGAICFALRTKDQYEDVAATGIVPSAPANGPVSRSGCC
jgi:hypothetical protein